MAQHDAARAHRQRVEQAGLVDGVDEQQDGQILAAGGDVLEHQRGRHEGGIAADQREVGRLLGDLVDQFVGVFGARRAHRDAGVSERADDGLGRLDGVIDDEES